jgi:hypothetical protein
MSRKPGPDSHDPFSPFLPPQTSGPLGLRDRADPNVNARPGDTPGSLGVNDGAYHVAAGWAGIAARMLASTIVATAPDAGMSKGGLFAYHLAIDNKPEAQYICSEPKKGKWRESVYVKNMNALAGVVGAAGFTVTELGILAHGDAGGRVWMGDDELNPATIENFTADFNSLDNTLTKDATVFIFGCVSGLEKDGSVLLKEVSKLLPGRKIVGFNVVNSVRPTGIRREGGNFLGFGSHPCYDPEVWASDSRSLLNVRNPYVNLATENAPQAKVAQSGKIIKWPSDESPKTDDAVKKDVLRHWKKLR